MPKIKIPEGSNALPWSYVFLILFVSISIVSAVMSFIESLFSPKKDPLVTPQPIRYETLDMEITEPPIIPETRERRYVLTDPRTGPLDFLYSGSSMTR